MMAEQPVKQSEEEKVEVCEPPCKADEVAEVVSDLPPAPPLLI